MKIIKKIIFATFSICLIFVLIVPVVSRAAEFKTGQTYSLYKGETISSNLYVAGSNVTIDGNVDGDLHTAGGNILVNGRVRDDLAAAGGVVNIIGEVGQDARLAGGNIIINNRVNGDLVIAGGTIEITSNASVRGDVLLAGGNIVINGPIEGNLKVRGGEVVINSEIRGKVDVAAANKLSINSRTIINGDFIYTSPSEAQIDSNAKIIGKVSYTPMQVKASRAHKAAFGAVLTFFWVAKLLALISCALIVFYFFRKETIQVAENSWENFAKNLLRGFVLLFLAPIAAIILLITLIGMPLAFLVLFIYLALLILAAIFSGIVFGGVLYQLLDRKLSAMVSWENIITGIVALMLIRLVPFIGWIIGFIFFLVALGAVSDSIFARLAPEK